KQQPAATAPAPQNSQPKVATPEPPTLPAATEEHDPAWAKQMESTLPKTVPELTNVKCAANQCTAQLSAATEQELTELATKLEDDDTLQAVGAKHVLYSRPAAADKPAMNVVVKF